MPEFLNPGVFVEEIPRGLPSIAGVSTNMAAFIGAAGKGPLNKPVRVSGVAEFTRQFAPADRRSDLGYSVLQFFQNGGSNAWIVRAARPLKLAQVTRAMRALDSVDLFNLLVLPGLADPDILAPAARYCEQRRAFLIADPPREARTPAEIKLAAAVLPDTNHAAVYFPWITIPDPENGGLRATPPSGAVAGVMARIDTTRGVWKAPAGLEATLQGVKGLAYNLTDQENSLLNPRAINCLRSFPGSGLAVWGARTLHGDDQRASEWKYIPVRRTSLFIEESIDRGTTWAVFEENDEALWAKLRLVISAFLQGLFRQGAFQGQTPREAYFVKCDRETTTAHDIAQGGVNIVVGFAPLKPAEFVIIRIRQRAGARSS